MHGAIVEAGTQTPSFPRRRDPNTVIPAQAGIQLTNFNCMDYSTTEQINALRVCLLN